MSRGLGTTQRALLLALARLEIAAAETMVRRHKPYAPPSWFPIKQILADAVANDLTDTPARAEAKALRDRGNTVSRVPAGQATSSRIAGRHHLGISGRHRRNPHATQYPRSQHSVFNGVGLTRQGLSLARSLGIGSAVIDLDRLSEQPWRRF